MKIRKVPDVVGFTADAGIDWNWVKDRVKEKERIRSGRLPEPMASISKNLEECLRIASHLVEPKIVSVKIDLLHISEGAITLKGPVSLTGNAFSRYLKGSKHAHLFIATIGSDLEETATMLMKNGDEIHGYLLDRIGSFAIESLAEGFEKLLRRTYRPFDMSVSMRLSPGYCDWPIEEQFKLDNAMDFSLAGVRLTESCMMIPRKSVSGLVGIGPKKVFAHSKSQCEICSKKSCDYKRTAVGNKRY